MRGHNNDTLCTLQPKVIWMDCSSRHGIVCLHVSVISVADPLETWSSVILISAFLNYLLDVGAVSLKTTRLDDLENTMITISFLKILDIRCDHQRRRCPSCRCAHHVDFQHRVAPGQVTTAHPSTLEDAFSIKISDPKSSTSWCI